MGLGGEFQDRASWASLRQGQEVGAGMDVQAGDRVDWDHGREPRENWILGHVVPLIAGGLGPGMDTRVG
jgi:hypothetical protein